MIRAVGSRAGIVVLAMLLAACAAVPETTSGPGGSTGPGPSGDGVPVATANPASPVPAAGHELYGFLPYWEMDNAGIADHVASLPLTTLALFSVTHTGRGVLNEKAHGYSLVTGDVGRGLIAAAHQRGT